jgi:hypothetical protein
MNYRCCKEIQIVPSRPYGLFITDVTVLGSRGGGKGFFDSNTNASVIKSVTIGDGVKKCSNCVTSFMEDPLPL